MTRTPGTRRRLRSARAQPLAGTTRRRGCDKRRRRLFAAPAAACGPALRPDEAPGFPVRESPGLSAFRPLRADLRLMIDISVLAVPAV
jgi:hypothetical protein